MSIEVLCIGKDNSLNLTGALNLKITYDAKNINRISIETVIQDQNGGNDYKHVSKIEENIKYGFDSSLAMTDFSEYPAIQ